MKNYNICCVCGKDAVNKYSGVDLFCSKECADAPIDLGEVWIALSLDSSRKEERV